MITPSTKVYRECLRNSVFRVFVPFPNLFMLVSKLGILKTKQIDKIP